jgi:hypothetical protein
MVLPLLDDQPDVLAPRAALHRRRIAAGHDHAALIVSRGWRIAARGGRWTVEVDDRARGTTCQLGLTPASLEALRRLVPGEQAPALDPFTEAILVDAGILIPAVDDHEPDLHLLSTARASFAADRFAVVPDLLHPYEVAAVRRYLRNRIRIGAFALGDPQVTKRHHAHNDPVLCLYQKRLVPLVAGIVGASVKPSYAYLSAYTAGSVLPPHRDRAQCEYTVTLQVDYTPEPTLEAGWPIRLALPDAEVTVYQSLGDALLFTGREQVHYRHALPRGHISTSLLLHYVDVDFEGPLE